MGHVIGKSSFIGTIMANKDLPIFFGKIEWCFLMTLGQRSTRTISWFMVISEGPFDAQVNENIKCTMAIEAESNNEEDN